MHTPHLSAFRSLAQALHAELAQALSELTRIRSAREQRAAWQDVEVSLLNHLRLEGELLLPAFDLAPGNNAARIREVHEQLRQLAIQLNERTAGAGLAEEVLHELRRQFAECVVLEERFLYPWADACVQQRKKGEFQQRSRPLASLATAQRSLRAAS